MTLKNRRGSRQRFRYFRSVQHASVQYEHQRGKMHELPVLIHVVRGYRVFGIVPLTWIKSCRDDGRSQMVYGGALNTTPSRDSTLILAAKLQLDGEELHEITLRQHPD
jgi:hypothetical protein